MGWVLDCARMKKPGLSKEQAWQQGLLSAPDCEDGAFSACLDLPTGMDYNLELQKGTLPSHFTAREMKLDGADHRSFRTWLSCGGFPQTRLHLESE